MRRKNYRVVNQHIVKKDSYSLMTGAAVFTEDLVPTDALYVKILRSPHAFARVVSVEKSSALADPDVECVLTWRDVPHHRHSFAGESYPGNNPQDRVILDEYVRYVGDPVAIIAARTESAAEAALAKLKVEYAKITPVLDFEQAETSESVVHPEEDYVFQVPVGGDLQHNVMLNEIDQGGDFVKEYAAAPIRLDETYYTKACEQAMMETFRTFSYFDEQHRLTLVSSTQIPFHARRIVSKALGLSHSQVRVIKPRIGGGFGAKQSVVCEEFPAVVTLITGKPAYYCMTRKESMTCSNTRHAFRIRVRLGAELDGTVTALWVDSLENLGAYAEHGVNVAGLSGHKTIPLYSKARGWRYTGKAVYTNTTPGGAFRGFGATQGCFAVESTVNHLAAKIGLDPIELRLKNLPQVGYPMPAYYNEVLQSCSLDRCLKTGRELFGWEQKYAPAPFSHKVGEHRYRGAGVAVTMQGSGLSNLDVGSVELRLEDDGFYALSIGASDMGTGCDTILAQMAAEILLCPVERVVTEGVDTSHSPYDKGSYASCTTYVTGNAVVEASKKFLRELKKTASDLLDVAVKDISFDGETFSAPDGKTLSVSDMSFLCVTGHHAQPFAGASYTGKTSPPPFVAGFAEVEVDTETGKVDVISLRGVVDCGTVINKNLARVQAEGGFSQGVGMCLYEDVVYSSSGRMQTDSFMNYKIPSRLDVPDISITFEESYEPTGPFGAKSIGEVVCNTPSPAILSAVYNAIGVKISSLPATPEKVYCAIQSQIKDN